MKQTPNVFVAFLQMLWRRLTQGWHNDSDCEINDFKVEQEDVVRNTHPIDPPSKVEIEGIIMKLLGDDPDWNECGFAQYGTRRIYHARNRKAFLKIAFTVFPGNPDQAMRTHETAGTWTVLRNWAAAAHPHADVSSLWMVTKCLSKEAYHHVNAVHPTDLYMLFKTDEYQVDMHVMVE